MVDILFLGNGFSWLVLLKLLFCLFSGTLCHRNDLFYHRIEARDFSGEEDTMYYMFPRVAIALRRKAHQ